MLCSEDNSAQAQRFRAFEEKCIQDPRSKGLNLTSLLITPIQRTPRYKLLLADLIKHTPWEHPDRKNLERAMAVVTQANIGSCVALLDAACRRHAHSAALRVVCRY